MLPEPDQNVWPCATELQNGDLSEEAEHEGDTNVEAQAIQIQPTGAVSSQTPAHKIKNSSKSKRSDWGLFQRTVKVVKQKATKADPRSQIYKSLVYHCQAGHTVELRK